MTDLMRAIEAVLSVGVVATALVLYFKWRASLRQQVLGLREPLELMERDSDAVLSSSFPGRDVPSGNRRVARPEPLWP